MTEEYDPELTWALRDGGELVVRRGEDIVARLEGGAAQAALARLEAAGDPEGQQQVLTHIAGGAGDGPDGTA